MIMRDETMKVGCENVPRRMGDIATELSRMDKELVVLKETVSLLSERFLHALRPVGAPQPGLEPSTKEPTEPCCELSGILHQHNRTIQETNEWIRGIIDRCEL